MNRTKLGLACLGIGLIAATGFAGWKWWTQEPMPDTSRYEKLISQLEPLHAKMGPTRSGDWLASHDEPGQTFHEYVTGDPVTPTTDRGTIYIQPLGEFSEQQRKIVNAASEYLELCYNLPVKVADDISLDAIPERARRIHPTWGDSQILTTYVLDELLPPRLPDDAAAYICFTTSDLWPGRGWNFVFGQASLSERVGVWSIHRKGDPHGTEDEYRTCLLRTIKTAAHETGHMFSMRHCTAYECTMCGSNSLAESDRRPLAMCPECVAKICFATNADPARRFAALETFCREHGLIEEAEFFQQSHAAVETAAAAPNALLQTSSK